MDCSSFRYSCHLPPTYLCLRIGGYWGTQRDASSCWFACASIRSSNLRTRFLLNLYRPEFSSTAIAIPRNPKPSFLGRGLLSFFVVVLVVAVLSVVFREILVSRNSVFYEEDTDRERERGKEREIGIFLEVF